MRISPIIAIALTLGLAPKSVLAQGHRTGGGGGMHRASPVGPPGKAPKKTPIDEFERMSPERQREALAKLPPDRRKKVENQLAQLRSLTPERQAILRETYSRLSELPADRREAVRKSFQKFGSQPADRQDAIRAELKQLGDLSPNERDAHFKSQGFRKEFNRGEQQIVRDMSELLPSH